MSLSLVFDADLFFNRESIEQIERDEVGAVLNVPVGMPYPFADLHVSEVYLGTLALRLVVVGRDARRLRAGGPRS
ncbi:MAG TPA: hypothetical protein VN797_09450 [Gemmatimonadaceae bacterium]|nr:hypothetical protein [Gemmatimonadaceae bacterium]